MCEYLVVERWTNESLCVLRCSGGRFHVARMLHVMPPKDLSLKGDAPRLGFGILLCEASGAVFRVIFESIDGAEPTPLAGRVQQASPASVHVGGANAGRGD